MKRRHLMMTFGAAAAGAVPAFFTASAAPKPTARPADADQEAAMPDGVPASEDHQKWVSGTTTVGSLSLLASRAAVDQADDAMVKQFAGWEVAEQETVGDILKSMKSDAPDARGELNPPTDEEAMAALDDAAKGKLEELKAMSGADFDKAYVAAQLEGHKTLLATQEAFLKAGKNRESLDVAKLARGMITEHIDHLTAIQADMG